MRRGYDQDWVWLDEGKTVIAGVSLGADFCAEHEWGIDQLKRQYGVPTTEEARASGAVGVARRRITRSPDWLVRHDDKKSAWLVSCSGLSRRMSQEPVGELLKRYTELSESMRGNGELSTAWDDCSFGLRTSIANKSKVDQLYKAFQENDILLTFRSTLPVFQNPGLCLVIGSAIPREQIAKVEEDDRDADNLHNAAQGTGIHAVLAKAGKGYYALSPRWKDDNKKDVRFWLNPMQQDKYNHGWYSVQELLDWASDKGPIVGKDAK